MWCRPSLSILLIVRLDAILLKFMCPSSLWVTIGPGPRKPWPDVLTVHSIPSLVLRLGWKVKCRGTNLTWRFNTLIGLMLSRPASPRTMPLWLACITLITAVSNVRRRL